MLLTAVALLGFASSPGGGPDPADAVCADTPDRTMIGITGGSTCSDLAGEGRFYSNNAYVPYLGNLVINTDGRMMGSCSTTNRCICVNMCEARICK